MKTNRYKLLLLGMLAAGITACGDGLSIVVLVHFG